MAVGVLAVVAEVAEVGVAVVTGTSPW